MVWSVSTDGAFAFFQEKNLPLNYLPFFLHWKGIKEIFFLAGDIIVVTVFWSGIYPPLFDSSSSTAQIFCSVNSNLPDSWYILPRCCNNSAWSLPAELSVYHLKNVGYSQEKENVMRMSGCLCRLNGWIRRAGVNISINGHIYQSNHDPASNVQYFWSLLGYTVIKEIIISVWRNETLESTTQQLILYYKEKQNV